MSDILKTLLYEWLERSLPEVTGRDLRLDTTPMAKTRGATVVTGFRRVGKTYLLYEAIQKLLLKYGRKEVVYLNFEDERIINPKTSLLTNLLPEIIKVYGKKPKYLFLDELQLIPHWSKWVRRILDTEEIEIFITRSSSKMGSRELPTEMRGRALEVKVDPLNFREFLKFKETEVDFEKMTYVKEEEARFKYLLEEFLVYGGLPGVVLSTIDRKQELLQSYFKTFVQMDICQRYKIDNEIALTTLLKLLLNSSHITISKLTNSLKSLGIPVGKSTVDNYLSYIRDSYFMEELFIYKRELINQLSYPRKVYFEDTGFMTALSTKFSKNIGRLWENIVFGKLKREKEMVFYLKDEKGREVDFAVFEGGKVKALYQVCFEITDRETFSREVKPLLTAGKKLKCTDLNLLIVEELDKMKAPKEIKVISAGEWLLGKEINNNFETRC